MSYSGVLTCTSCKRQNVFTHRYCCDPSQHFCTICSTQECSRCHQKRSKILNNDHFREKPQRMKIIKCVLCMNHQQSFRAEFFYEQKCKTYYCHPCMIKMYDRYCDISKQMELESGIKIDLPVDLTCGCEIDKQNILRYFRPYCYECSRKLCGSSILLNNQCRIQTSCIQRLKRNAEHFKEREALSKWNFIKQSLIVCMNCENIIDGDLKSIGNEIDGMYVCSFCLDLTEYNEKLYSSRIKSYASTNESNFSSGKKVEKNGKAVVKLPSELGRNIKPHLVNGNKYRQTRCKFCNAGIEVLTGQQSLCEICIQIQQPVAAHAPPQPIKQNKVKKEQLLTDDKNLLKLGNQTNLKGKKQIVIQQKQQKMPLLDDSPEPDINLYSNKDLSFLRQQQQKSQKDDKNQKVKQQFKYIKQQARQQVLRQEKEQIKPQDNQQLKEQVYNELKQIYLNKQQSSVNQEFLPLKVQVLSIKVAVNAQNKCQRCNYLLLDQNYYKTYEKDDGNPQSLRIAQTQQQITKHQKQNKIMNVCSNCFLNLKWKLKLAQQKLKKQKQLQYYSSRYRSVPKKPRIQEPFAVTLTNVKKAQEKKKQKAKEIMCFGCLKYVPQTQFSTSSSRYCRNCVFQAQKKAQSRVKCKKCYRQFVKEKDNPDQNPMCATCRYVTQSMALQIQKRSQAKAKCRICSNFFVKERNSSSLLLMCSSCRYATRLMG